MAKIESLYGTTPVEIFESGLENIGEIQDVAVSVLWKDGSVTVGWSSVERENLVLLIMTLQEKLRRTLFDDLEL
ncbi:hypothetical protein [Sneathiella sp.]|uniref:hypothetical protein n=1 Tax=Sneathiella sp. TaxID=1964365 RepID=UPI0035669E95